MVQFVIGLVPIISDDAVERMNYSIVCMPVFVIIDFVHHQGISYDYLA